MSSLLSITVSNNEMYRAANDHLTNFKGCVVFYLSSTMKTCYFDIIYFSLDSDHRNLLF